MDWIVIVGLESVDSKKFLVHQIEDPVQITGSTVESGKLFHKILLDFGGVEAYNKHTLDNLTVFSGLPLSELPLWQGLFYALMLKRLLLTCLV